MELGMWSSITIVVGFSFFVIFLDEYVLKPWRKRKWERLAASGDKEAQEMLRIAKSAKVKSWRSRGNVLTNAVRLSQRVGEASGNPPVEGTQWALAVLAVLFLLRATVSEFSRREAATGLNDLQWGLAAGCALAALWRFGVFGA